VTYRAELEAARARAEALEQELADARREVAELRATPSVSAAPEAPPTNGDDEARTSGGGVAKMGAAIAVLVLAGAVSVVVWLRRAPSGRETPAPSEWDGRTPLVCRGDQRIHIVGCRASLEGKTAVDASNGCEITLERCTVRARIGVSAAHDAKVRLVGCDVQAATAIALQQHASAVVEGGRIEGTEQALHLWHDTRVDVRGGAAVVGRIVRYHNARVTGVPAVEREQAAEDVGRRHGPRACELAIGCYGADFVGNLAGRLALDVNASGLVTAATHTGTAPPEVTACFAKLAGEERLVDYKGGAGKLVCTYAGSMIPGTIQMNRDWKFEPAE
jgi:hypothetical protein